MTTGERTTVSRGRGPDSRASQVYQVLVGRIRAGELAPGARLREDEIGTQFGVSRTPVRQALTRLQARGLAEPVSGGLVVVELTRPRILELYAMRGILEGAAARFAAQNASASDLVSLKHVERLFGESSDQAADMAQRNVMFHEAIYEAAHNQYLMRMLADLNDSLALLPDTTFLVPGRATAAVDEHRAMLAAIEAGQPDAAEAAARAHISAAMDARMTLIFAVPGVG